MKITAPLWLFTVAALFFVVVYIPTSEAAMTTNKRCLEKQIVPKVSFRVKNAKIKLNRSKSSAQITRFAKSLDAYKPTTKGRLLGLAYTEVRPNLGVEVEGVFAQNKQKCIRLSKVSFEFGLKKSEIFIDRKYRPGTCAYKAVLAHEKEHMRISQKLQKIYAKKIEKELKHRAKTVRPFLASNTKRAANVIVKRLMGQVTPLVDEFKKERKRQNMKIDTPQSYRKVRSRCANW